MNWIVLIFAGCFEVAMTFCLGKTKGIHGTEFYLWILGFILSAAISMWLLSKAVQTLPIGTAYAIWTGIGALGTVLIGIFVFKEPVSFLRLFFIFTLFASIIGLKMVSD
ncbi:MAG TPA: multidrug efflux SMR transporter [Candidatus Onthomorpha intestinigallinarum]|uniref:Guanidinium exporter n=1 Tax=Candidatus Onthomorpha intestinigallinarum TaxID=2840880 RepID=A0A9D1RK12_9BACT|nr:multidrug efflux SMR transporter [Candidatus Onthomorpha intestinigallinarum]